MFVSWRASNRRGVGIAVALVCWVVAMALLFALIANQSSSGALSAMARATFTNTMALAGESAIDEVAYRLRHLKRSTTQPPFTELHLAGTSAATFAPSVTKRLFSDTKVTGGLLTIEPVKMSVWYRPTDPTSNAPWLIDLSVEVKFSLGGGLVSNFTRVVKRRYQAQVYQVFEVLGPKDNLAKVKNKQLAPGDPKQPIGQVVYSELTLAVDPVLEMVIGK